jgi:pimeloyl-ACP methyl ester carboxylesterase
MVLVDSVVFDALPTPELRALASLEAAQRTPHLMEVAIPTAFDLGMRRRDRLADEALQEYLRPWIADGGVAAYFRAAEESTSRVLLDRAPELSALEIPVLLLWGEEDPFFPVAMAERLQEAMPTASLALLPGCGHFLPEEATETIGPLMLEWLRARYLGEGHEHPEPAGPIAISLGRRPPIEQEFLGEFTPDEAEDETEEADGHEEGSA